MSFEQRWRRRRGFEITYGYRFDRNHFYDPEPDPDDFFPLDVVENDGRLTGAFLFDRRLDPVSPTGGTFTSLSFERAAGWLASDSSYTKLLLQQYGFWSRGSLVLAGRVMGGRTVGSDIPLDQRFLAGGATTVRGYGENALGPRDIFGLAVGGTQLLILNQELRFPIHRWFRGVGFLDVGNTFDRDVSVRLEGAEDRLRRRPAAQFTDRPAAPRLRHSGVHHFQLRASGQHLQQRALVLRDRTRLLMGAAGARLATHSPRTHTPANQKRRAPGWFPSRAASA